MRHPYRRVASSEKLTDAVGSAVEGAGCPEYGVTTCRPEGSTRNTLRRPPSNLPCTAGRLKPGSPSASDTAALPNWAVGTITGIGRMTGAGPTAEDITAGATCAIDVTRQDAVCRDSEPLAAWPNMGTKRIGLYPQAKTAAVLGTRTHHGCDARKTSNARKYARNRHRLLRGETGSIRRQKSERMREARQLAALHRKKDAGRKQLHAAPERAFTEPEERGASRVTSASEDRLLARLN